MTSWRDAEPRSFWWEAEGEPVPEPLRGPAEADLCVVGGGFTGLWAALAAAERDPGRRIVLLEAEHAGFGGSGRNGGFCVSSLTHGLANGLARFPEETDVLERLGRANLDGLIADLGTHGIGCDWEPVGDVLVATEPHQEPWMDEEAELLTAHGHQVELWDEARTQREIASPTYRRAVWNRTGGGILDPGKLARGLRDAARRAGVEVAEGTPARGLERAGAGVRILTPEGEVRAARALLATGASPPLLRAVRRYVAPVYDYVLVTEPLDAAQRASLGWAGRQGVGDSGNRFHYYRLTADDRILWGGYEAVYRYGGRVGPEHDEDPRVFSLLSEHFFATFPQLEGLAFTHRWGGAIDTCSRFSAFFGSALGGRAVYVAGYTGLGVGASRFGARTALDLLDGRDTETTRLRYVRSRPVPFPPEPLRSAVIQLTRNRLAAADRNAGRRGLWLRTLDALGLGFDS
jgi:glycine/D-amino acid oxidase-like deaminating enzyme